MKMCQIQKILLKATANVLKIFFMKLNDSDLISDYNSTKRLGNPDTPAAGDSKQLRENMHNTTNVAISEFDSLMEQRAYKEFIDHFSDTVVSAEDLLSPDRLAKAIIEVLQEQQTYHLKQAEHYNSIIKAIQSGWDDQWNLKNFNGCVMNVVWSMGGGTKGVCTLVHQNTVLLTTSVHVMFVMKSMCLWLKPGTMVSWLLRKYLE